MTDNNYTHLLNRLVQIGLGKAEQTTSIDVVGFLKNTWFRNVNRDPVFEVFVAGLDSNIVIQPTDGDDWHIRPLDAEPVPDSIKSIIEAARDLRSDDGTNAEYDRGLVELIWSGVRIPELGHLESDEVRELIEGWVTGE